MRTILEVVLMTAALAVSSLAAAVDVPEQSLQGVVDRDVAAPAAADPFEVSVAPAELARRAAVQLKSRAALVVRADNGEVLYRKNSDRPLPIASITKLMTAMVVLDAQQSFDDVLTVTSADVDRVKRTASRLAVGTRLTRGEFMQLALMASENRAASVLARNYPGGRAAAIGAMNRKARELGMTSSKFVDGTGLSPANRASPVDLVRLVKAADGYADIRRFSTAPRQTVKVGRRLQAFGNTNPLVRSPEWSIDLTKTGFINEAGRCLVMQARIADLPVILVLMDSVGTKTRVGDANRVRKWLEAALPAQARQASARPLAAN
ncbi:MAG: serine hydrolase [Gammaproteobacteria bacterium]